MFGIGTTELLLVLLVALIVLGPRKLPEIATKLGQAVGAFRRMSTEFQRTLNAEVATLEEKEKATAVEVSVEHEKETVHSAPTPLEELYETSKLTSENDKTLAQDTVKVSPSVEDTTKDTQKV